MHLLSVLFAAGLLVAETPDTLRTVTVVADRGVVVSKTDTVSISSSYDVNDVLSRIPALYVGDCGGAAGLKTVNLRGLGSAHTALYVDGVRVGNVQGGQMDLTLLGMEDFGAAVVDYAQNSISFNTSRPVFGNRPISGSACFQGGSFSTYKPRARVDFRLSDALSLSATVAGTSSRGDFPYSDTQRRTNNDIRQIRGGLDLWGVMKGGDFHAKAGYNWTDRGTPGSCDYPSEDRQKDRNAYIQGLLRKNFSSLYALNLSAKAAYDDTYYASPWGDSNYGQTEFQLNSAHRFQMGRRFSLSLAADIQWDGLKSTGYEASRLGAVAAVSAAIRLERFSADAALEYSHANDIGQDERNCLSPSLDLRFTAFDGFDIVAFGRRAYRVPTFNELYYPGFGNPALKPEDAWLTDLGVEWSRKDGKWSFSAKADGFYNHLKDKIVSAPTADNPNIWLPYNVGVAEMYGADSQVSAGWTYGPWKAGITAKYSFQQALDKTPGSSAYGSRIPYIARHTAFVNASAAYSGWTLDAVWNLRAGRSDGYGEMPDWSTLDLTFSKVFKFGKDLSLGLSVKARNLTDCRYELCTGYPMPGRAFYGGIEFNF